MEYSPANALRCARLATRDERPRFNHAWAFGRETVDTWGCDYAPSNVGWIKQHLTNDIKALVNTDVPHLPFPDGYFDVVTAFSVFTHIDVLEDAWLLELRRITRPGGLLYLTIHNEATWEKLRERPEARAHLSRAIDPPDDLDLTEARVAGPMPRQRFALRMSRDDIYNCNVWMSSDYVREQWSRYATVAAIADNAHLQYQSVVLLTVD